MKYPPPPLTGTYHNQNYVWAIAMNLAWNELITNQLGGEARVESDHPIVNELVDRLNAGVFSHELLDAAAYFIRSGIGPEAVADARADLLREKNVAKSLLDTIVLRSGELFSYARVEKALKWLTAFEKCVGLFQDRKVEAFQPTRGSRKGIDVLEYDPEQSAKSVIRLFTDDEKDQVYLMGGYELGREAEMVARVATDGWEQRQELYARDTLIIPAVNFFVSRDYQEMIGQELLNPRLPNVFISDMKDEVRFSMNHKGVEFVAEARIVVSRSAFPPPPKRIVFDQPFLIVLKQSDQQLPYLAVGVNNTDILSPIKTLHKVGRALPDGTGIPK